MTIGAKFWLLKEQLTNNALCQVDMFLYRHGLGGWSQQIEKERAELEQLVEQWEHDAWVDGFITGWKTGYKGEEYEHFSGDREGDSWSLPRKEKNTFE